MEQTTFDEIAERIESFDFRASVEIVGGTSAFLAAVGPHELTRQLVRYVAYNRVAIHDVGRRFRRLLEIEPEAPYRNPFDVAITVYALVLSDYNVTHAGDDSRIHWVMTQIQSRAVRCLWANRIARVLEDGGSFSIVSDTGTSFTSVEQQPGVLPDYVIERSHVPATGIGAFA